MSVFGTMVTIRKMAIVAMISLVFLPLTNQPAAAQEYLLSHGDSIRVFIPGMPGADNVAQINLDGQLRLPYIGEVEAAGQTLDDLETAINRQAAGKLAVFYSMDGTRQEILLGDISIFVTIEAYRDISVTGAVRAPGPVPFRPGMTVRAAIAAAGGPGAALDDEIDPVTAQRLIGELEARAAAEAEYLISLWHLDSLLSGQIEPLSEQVSQIVASRLGPDAEARMAERIQLTIDLDKRGDDSIVTRLKQADQRIEFLEKTVDGYEQAIEIQAAQLASVQSLFERGLTSNDRLSDIQNDTILSNTRLLTTEAQLAEARSSRDELLAQSDSRPDTRREQRIRDRVQAEVDLAETRARLNSLRNQVALTGQSSSQGGLSLPALQVTVIRGSGSSATRIYPELDDLLRPGDVLDVALQEQEILQ